MSGMRYWSDSAIRVKPSIDEPSNHVPCSTEPSSWWIGMVTALTTPMMSVNWSWMKRMPSLFAWAICARGSTWVPFNRSNQLLYIHHLQAFVFDRVSEQSAGRQHPYLNLPWVVQSFPLARFPVK